MRTKLSILLGIVIVLSFSGGVYAKKVIDQYQTPRGNFAVIEQENIHKNRIGVTVNGKAVETDTWYIEKGVTYIPLREVSELLGAEVDYIPETFSANIKMASGNIETADWMKLNVNGKIFTLGAPVIEAGGDAYVSVNDVAKALGSIVNYENHSQTITLLPENKSSYKSKLNAKWEGEIELFEGNKWWLIETKYTRLHFHNKALSLEWVSTEVDQMFEYLMEFRNLKWDGRKIDILFVDRDESIKERNSLFGTYYSKHNGKEYIVVGSEFGEGDEMTMNGKLMKEDPRAHIVHELTHYLHIPDNIKNEDKWLDEGLANYLSYHYDYQKVDVSKYPDARNRAKFDVDLALEGNPENILKAVHDQIRWNFDSGRTTPEGQKLAKSFEGIAKIHYRMGGDIGGQFSIQFFEASIIEYFINTYGVDKLEKIYNTLHSQQTINIDKALQQVYNKSLKQLEHEWRNYVGL